MPDLMTSLAELVTEINRIDPSPEDPLRHAKRACKRHAQTTLEHAVAQAWMSLDEIQIMVSIMEDTERAAQAAKQGEPDGQ